MKCLALITVALITTPALAEESNFCAERPGQTTPPCVVAPGKVMFESTASAWTLTNNYNSRTDNISVVDSVLRAGVAPLLEAQLGWTPGVYVRVRDKVTGDVSSSFKSGDVSLGLLYGLSGQNGPVSIQGFVTLPAGRTPVGAGDWGAGARLPVQFNIGAGFQIGLTPEVDAKVNSTGSGRHLAYGGAFGLGYSLTDTLSLSADIAVFRDKDPLGAATTAITSSALAWMVTPTTQLDIGVAAGLNSNSPDMQLHLGIAHLF